MKPTDLAAVLVTWNSAEVVGNCLRSLRAAAGPLEIEIVIVDNGSRDGTVTAARAADPEARIIANATNRGLPAANNQGLAATVAPFVLIANPDTEFRPGSVTTLLNVLVRRPEVGWVVPRLIYEDGSPQTSAGELPSLVEAIAGRQVARWLALRGHRSYWSDGRDPDVEARIGRGHEAAYIVRRSAVNVVGPQDERYVLDWEGFDWADRFGRAGWEIWMAPGAEVVHLGGVSIRSVPYRWIVSHHRGMYLYFADRRPGYWKPALIAVFAARASVKMAMVAAGMPMYEWAQRSRRPEVSAPAAAPRPASRRRPRAVSRPGRGRPPVPPRTGRGRP